MHAKASQANKFVSMHYEKDKALNKERPPVQAAFP